MERDPSVLRHTRILPNKPPPCMEHTPPSTGTCPDEPFRPVVPAVVRRCRLAEMHGHDGPSWPNHHSASSKRLLHATRLVPAPKAASGQPRPSTARPALGHKGRRPPGLESGPFEDLTLWLGVMGRSTQMTHKKLCGLRATRESNSWSSQPVKADIALRAVSAGTTTATTIAATATVLTTAAAATTTTATAIATATATVEAANNTPTDVGRLRACDYESRQLSPSGLGHAAPRHAKPWR